MTETATSAHGTPPLAIGDSTLILSLKGLAAHGVSGNAHGCREYYQGIELMEELKRQGDLPEIVIVALGANGGVSEEDITKALRAIGPHRTLVVVTHLVEGRQPAPDYKMLLSQANKYPGRVAVLDWVAYSHGHPEWFEQDGLHLTFAGADAYAAFLATGVPQAQQLKAPPKKPQHTQGAHAPASSGGISGWTILLLIIACTAVLLWLRRRAVVAKRAAGQRVGRPIPRREAK